jgi:hypothetical protein
MCRWLTPSEPQNETSHSDIYNALSLIIFMAAVSGMRCIRSILEVFGGAWVAGACRVNSCYRGYA